MISCLSNIQTAQETLSVTSQSEGTANVRSFYQLMVTLTVDEDAKIFLMETCVVQGAAVLGPNTPLSGKANMLKA